MVLVRLRGVLGRSGRRTVRAVLAVGCAAVSAVLPVSTAFAAAPNQPAPPRAPVRAPLRVSVGLPATVIADGAALRVTADVVCSVPGTTLTLILVQRSGERIAHGVVIDRPGCGGATDRTVLSMPAQDAPFHPGVAFVQASLNDCSQFPCSTDVDEAVITVSDGDVGSGLPQDGAAVLTTDLLSTGAGRAENTVEARLAAPMVLLAEGTAVRVPVDFTCGVPRTGFVAVAVTQRVGNRIAHGAVEDSRTCTDRADHIVITIPAVDTRFEPGPAFVQVRLTSCILNPEIPCFLATDEATVTLPAPTG